MKNVDMVDYALNTAISEIDKQEKADSTLSTKRSDAETAAQSYITTTANAEAGTKDWNERIGKLTDKEKHTLKKLQEEVNANVKSYLTAIQKAQTQEALDSAVASFNAAAELEAERILAGWQLDEKAGNDPTLQETAETYKGYIDLSKDVGSIKQLLDTGLKEMDSQGSLVTARNAAKNTIKDHVKKIYTDYSSYFSDFSFTPDNEPSFWSAFEKKFDSANSLLKTWNTNIETSTDSVSITNVLTENAQSKLDDQFIKDLAADLVIKLGTEATGRKFCNPETPTVSGEPLVKVYDFDDLSKFKTSLESSIGTADPKVGTAEARADRTISAYNDALGQLADAEAFSLTVIGLGAEPTTNYYKNGDTVFLEASTMDEKQHAFKNWTCGERTVGTRRLTVTMTKNCEWTANYREDERPYAPPSENKQHITAKLDEDKLTLRATREIYNGSVKQHGILFSTFSPKLEFSNDYERDITTGYIMQDGARVSISNKIDDTEIGTYEVSMVWGRANPKSPQIYARGYYILEDGTVHYSENVVVITQNEGKWDNTANSDSTKTYEDIQSKGCGL